ncbi:orotidine-5'-phosphate decarboxylase [Candidatus Pelagibacter sp.]|nr:orotidine-5'-phosphate decarboxylase [Candidatus Pelagibacter sp.]
MKNKKKKIIFVACDTSNLKQTKKIINQTKTDNLNIIPKFGMQFFYSKNGRKFLEKFKKPFFLDVKISDVPNTALSALDSLKDLKGLRYITIHASGGLDMLKAVVKKAKKINKNIKVLGVTILTSLNNKSVGEIGYINKIDKLVLKQLALIRKSGAAGCICSANEALIIRKKYKNLFIVTPGIRLPGDKKNDQKRVMTPKDAFKNKASAIVLGRSLTKGNIKNNIKKLADHLNK